MDEEELEGAEDGVEHLQTSQASRRLTALSAAAPSELASHVQVGYGVLVLALACFASTWLKACHSRDAYRCVLSLVCCLTLSRLALVRLNVKS